MLGHRYLRREVLDPGILSANLPNQGAENDVLGPECRCGLMAGRLPGHCVRTMQTTECFLASSSGGQVHRPQQVFHRYRVNQRRDGLYHSRIGELLERNAEA